MLAEIGMFFQILSMAFVAAIVPFIVLMCAIYLAYKYRVQIWWFIKGIMRAISWLLIGITDGKAVADRSMRHE